MNFFLTLKTIAVQALYTVLFGWQCAKLTIYGAMNFVFAIIYLFVWRAFQMWKATSLKETCYGKTN